MKKKAKTKRKGGATGSAKKAAAPTKKSAKKSAGAKKPAKKSAAKKAAKKPAVRKSGGSTGKWLAFVEKHGVVLASARGPVPSVAEAVAGEPIVGSWWSHPKAHQIFEVLSAIDDDLDVRCFKLVDGKVTFVHRRVWPALVRLARDGVISGGRVASVQQEHMPTGEHRNLITPFPDWVPDEVARSADALSVDQARAQLGAWASA